MLRNLHQLHLLLLSLDHEGLLDVLGGAEGQRHRDHLDHGGELDERAGAPGQRPTGAYLELQVLAAVVPLKQDAALSSAPVEAPQGRLVALHLLQHL